MNLHLTPRQDGPGMPCFELHIPMPTFRDGVWGWFGGSKYLSEEVRRSRCRVRQTCRNAVLVERKFRSAHGLQKAPITWQLFARYAGKNFLTHALLLRDLNKTGSFRSNQTHHGTELPEPDSAYSLLKDRVKSSVRSILVPSSKARSPYTNPSSVRSLRS